MVTEDYESQMKIVLNNFVIDVDMSLSFCEHMCNLRDQKETPLNHCIETGIRSE